VAETTIKRLLCCGFRRAAKAMGHVFQCWWRICREINIFFSFEYHIFCIIYLFVFYLLIIFVIYPIYLILYLGSNYSNMGHIYIILYISANQHSGWAGNYEMDGFMY
jgi:hypothetical protein